jgi:hypothetical protein
MCSKARSARGSLLGMRSPQLNGQLRIIRLKIWSKSPPSGVEVRGVLRDLVSVNVSSVWIVAIRAPIYAGGCIIGLIGINPDTALDLLH